VGKVDMGLNGWRPSNDSRTVAVGSTFDFKLGGRWRPWQRRGLEGGYAGLGLEKQVLVHETWSFGDYFPVGGNSFGLDQFFTAHAELGWQWVWSAGILLGAKLDVPFYSDGLGSDQSVLTQFSTLSLDLGFAW
jgi:hypothetical protein